MKKESLLLALLKCKNIGNKKALDILEEYHFDCDKLYKNIKLNILEDDYDNFNNYLGQANNQIEINQKHEIKIITIFDDNFPKKLLADKDPILYLYYKGNINILNEKIITIIGTRHPTEKGIEFAKKAGSIFGSKNIVVLSGLALGSDINAHKGCLDAKGKTIAVLPSDLKSIAPTSNRSIADEIVKNNGCLISEYSIGTPFNKFNYAKRDRIQSALADLILVAEASENSGTMIAVKSALSSNKPVYMSDFNINKIITKKLDINDSKQISNILNEIEQEYSKANVKKAKSEQFSLFDM